MLEHCWNMLNVTMLQCYKVTKLWTMALSTSNYGTFYLKLWHFLPQTMAVSGRKYIR